MGTTTMITLFHFPSIGPSLQTPRPKQPYNDRRYHHLLESRTYPHPLRYSSSPSSSNPSPSSTLCSSGSGSTLVHDEDVDQIKKALWPSPSPSVASPSSHLSKKVEFQRWMLNPGSASYALLFPPIESEMDPEPEEEGGKSLDAKDPFPSDRGQTPSPIVSSPLPFPSPIQRPPKRQRIAGYRHVHPRTAWSEFFQRGCRSRNRDAMHFFARKIVHSQRWDEDEDVLLGLVHAFVRHAVDVNVDAQERECMGVFASRVRDALRSIRLDLRFRELMKETVLATFISCWHLAPENPDAITYSLADTPSPSYLFYGASALHLCSFIGDLYLEKFLSRSDTIGCIRIIFYNLSLVDHITAVGNILKRAGTALWKEASFPIPKVGGGGKDNLDREVSEFEVQMQRAMRVVQDHRYLFVSLGNDEPLGNGAGSARLIGVVERKVGSLVRYVRECRRFVIEGRATDGVLVAIGPDQVQI